MRLPRRQKREARYLRVKEARRVQVALKRRAERAADALGRSTVEETATAVERLRRERGVVESRVRAAVAGAGLRVCIELSFENSDRGKRSLCRQISGAYGISRRSLHPLHLHLSSLSEPLRCMLAAQGLDAWHITRLERSAMDSFEKDSIVVLTPDAPDTLEVFDPDKVYVIGGIIDRSVRKAVTLEWAAAHGVCTKRLPVREYLEGKPKIVLNIDAVVGVVCRFLETSDWKVSLESAIPLRHCQSVSIDRKSSS